MLIYLNFFKTQLKRKTAHKTGCLISFSELHQVTGDKMTGTFIL